MVGDFYCDEVFSGRTPVEVVHETADVLAFKHTRPHWAGAHVVVVPRRHIPSFIEFAEQDATIVAEVLAVARLVAALVTAERGGAHIVTNVGAYQESKHLHIHVGAE
ncbi:MAG: HIT domain-containing protein [Chloroflexi bacterium]|nr:HIT domain-containing protein [Chloroflexota bacterium]